MCHMQKKDREGFVSNPNRTFLENSVMLGFLA